MITLEPPFRWAREADAPVLAELVNHAGEGIPHHMWQGMAGPGEDPWAIGAARQRVKIAGDAEIVVVDEGAGPIAGLTGYRIPDDPEPLDDLPPIVVPLQELENLVPATWYVNVLAALPGHRAQGWGTKLLGVAERIAADAGLTGLSIIVADSNLLARRLYERTGYAELARREAVADGWRGEVREWILMTKGAGSVPEAEEDET